MMAMELKYCHDGDMVDNDSSLDAEMYLPQHKQCSITTNYLVPELVDDDELVSDDMYDVSCDSCDACPCCEDICTNSACIPCIRKTELLRENQWRWRHQPPSPSFRLFGSLKTVQDDRSSVFLTRCQVRRRNHSKSAWLLCGDAIYDATDYINNHPGGNQSIIRKSGGAADCTLDMSFHSGRSIKLWKQCRIGTLRPCPGEEGFVDDHDKGEQCVVS